MGNSIKGSSDFAQRMAAEEGLCCYWLHPLDFGTGIKLGTAPGWMSGVQEHLLGGSPIRLGPFGLQGSCWLVAKGPHWLTEGAALGEAPAGLY